MSAHVRQELRARGVARVLVVLREPLPAEARARAAALPAGSVPAGVAGTVAAALARHFAEDTASQPAALVRAAAEGRPWRAAVRVGQARGTACGPVPPVRVYPHLGVLLGAVDAAGYAALRADPRVLAVTGVPALSPIRPRRRAAARLRRRLTWGLEALRVPALWRQGLTGRGVRVGHLDTGVDGRHPALRGAIARFAEFDDLGREVRPAPSPFDSDEHGTHTAATIAGRPVGGRHVGVAPGAELAAALVIEGGDVVARVLGGLDWAVGQGVRVLSLSLGFRGWWEDFLPLTRLLRARGVLPVFAVGNEGPGTSRSPGNYAEALSVGAADRAGRVAEFSSSQRFRRRRDPVVPDLVAPGVDVVSAVPGRGYATMDGTSMATPHVAGLAALLLEARPDRSVAQVETALLASCRLAPGVGPERAGRGIPDAVRALELL